MNYSLLHKKLETSKINITEMFKNLDLSKSSFYYSLENKTIKVATLEKICDAAGIDIVELFIESKGGDVNEPISKYGLKNEVAELKQKCAEYQATIKSLNEYISLLKKNSQKNKR